LIAVLMALDSPPIIPSPFPSPLARATRTCTSAHAPDAGGDVCGSARAEPRRLRESRMDFMMTIIGVSRCQRNLKPYSLVALIL
jgi:hypothetical protein